MKLRELENPDLFLATASPLLTADEARHNLMFGICATLAEIPDAYPAARLWTIEEADAVVGAAMMTPPFNVIVAKPRTGAALRFLAGELHRRDIDLPGVTGALPEADEFAAAWEKLTRAQRRPRMHQGIYQASSVRPPDGVPGRMRLATGADRQLVLNWWQAFADESLPADAPRGHTEAHVDRRLASSTGGVALWEDGEPVSLASFGGRTPNGVRIGPVYTPPRWRRRGYASALVGNLTRHLLEDERDFCFLYTDLANPSSNRIYQDLGYEVVAESVDYAFDAPQDGS
jgi:ribosomal protein S18 acetylase RimI-like enzyme